MLVVDPMRNWARAGRVGSGRAAHVTVDASQFDATAQSSIAEPEPVHMRALSRNTALASGTAGSVAAAAVSTRRYAHRAYCSDVLLHTSINAPVE